MRGELFFDRVEQGFARLGSFALGEVVDGIVDDVEKGVSATPKGRVARSVWRGLLDSIGVENPASERAKFLVALVLRHETNFGRIGAYVSTHLVCCPMFRFTVVPQKKEAAQIEPMSQGRARRVRREERNSPHPSLWWKSP